MFVRAVRKVRYFKLLLFHLQKSNHRLALFLFQICEEPVQTRLTLTLVKNFQLQPTLFFPTFNFHLF